ncbi:hypothetical protein L1077_25375 [Pseudoalteromonas luteoviolacea]|uniref:hypothetical protein n=1 Tax=Pseudoalteromonas luteoviolacea TaxID=43657 RepID=UPI001F23C5EE|nr:hypothetical protein [Pseudoalteromonas luteoviolacea]MCF6442758.1 hypothetical protein [Pseudoalteromonas luteoviolacea]
MPQLFESRLDLYCNPTEDNIIELSKHIENIAYDFKNKVINSNSVEYINFSGGYEIQRGLVRTWNRHCIGGLPSKEKLSSLYNTVRPFYEVLFNSPGVMAFRALGINMTEYNNELDIDKSYENRLLVAPFTTLDSKLPENGFLNGRPPSLDYSIDNSKKWIDYLVNFGIIPFRPFPYNDTSVMATTTLGLSYTPISDSSTSWSSPVALSTAVFIKSTEYSDFPLDNILIGR